jgi:hypothetical protein
MLNFEKKRFFQPSRYQLKLDATEIGPDKQRSVNKKYRKNLCGNNNMHTNLIII